MEKNEPTQSKYDAALAKYNTQLDDAEIAAQAATRQSGGWHEMAPDRLYPAF